MVSTKRRTDQNMSYTAYSDEPDQDERIAKLRAELEKLGGNPTALDSMPADMEEEFLRHVLEYETTQPMSLFTLLENAGFEIPAVEQLRDDQVLAVKLRELVERMASFGAYLLHTDHLSDRELYEYLFHEGLREEARLFPENPSYAYLIDLTGSGSEEDINAYLKYYASEDYRRQWAHDWPDTVMPAHEAPPFNRDSTLPQSPV